MAHLLSCLLYPRTGGPPALEAGHMPTPRFAYLKTAWLISWNVRLKVRAEGLRPLKRWCVWAFPRCPIHTGKICTSHGPLENLQRLKLRTEGPSRPPSPASPPRLKCSDSTLNSITYQRTCLYITRLCHKIEKAFKAH